MLQSRAAAVGAWNPRNAQAMSQSSDSLELMKQMQSQAPSNKEHFQEAELSTSVGLVAPAQPKLLSHSSAFSPIYTFFGSRNLSRKLPTFALSEMELMNSPAKHTSLVSGNKSLYNN